MRKWLSIICCIMVLCVPLTVNAAEQNAVWNKVVGATVESWSLQDADGTNLIARLEGNTLYIDGTGAIPAYTLYSLGNRPWNGRSVYELVIGNGVTEIGANAFAGLIHLYRVTMPSSILIKDTSAFKDIQDEAYFMIKGMNIADYSIGKVKYSSIQSIVELMLAYNGNYRYQLDNMYMRQLAQSYSPVVLENLAPLDAITKAVNPDYPVINYASSVSETEAYANEVKYAFVKQGEYGESARAIFAMMLDMMEGYEFVRTYDMAVGDYTKVITKSSVPYQYTMTIPAAYRLAGREHALIQLGNGEINILCDEDTKGDTITFTTDAPTAIYALVYKDTF